MATCQKCTAQGDQKENELAKFGFVKGRFRLGSVKASMERTYTWNSVVAQTETLEVVERAKPREDMWHVPAAEWCTVVAQSSKFSFRTETEL